MYKILYIENDEMTKNIELKNMKTGTIDKCFDDSAIVSDKNFDFINVGEEMLPEVEKTVRIGKGAAIPAGEAEIGGWSGSGYIVLDLVKQGH